MDKEGVVYVCMCVCVCVCIYTHTMEYYSAIKELSNAICSRMDESRDYHTKSEKDKYYMISLICGI